VWRRREEEEGEVMEENVAFRFNFAGAATTPQPQVCLLLPQDLRLC
jgi:hypothetical protein